MNPLVDAWHRSCLDQVQFTPDSNLHSACLKGATRRQTEAGER